MANGLLWPNGGAPNDATILDALGDYVTAKSIVALGVYRLTDVLFQVA